MARRKLGEPIDAVAVFEAKSLTVYIPEFTGSPTDWVVLAFALTFPLFFITEATGWLSFGYSKFSKDEQASIPSRAGMLVVYLPAALVYPAIHLAGGAPGTTWHLAAMVLLSVHFLKRCAETLWVHRYSGVMNSWTVVVICGLYTLVSGLLGFIATYEVPASLVSDAGLDASIGLGLAFWALGTGINAWHHVLLAGLRKPGETGYKLPTGGLFGRVACPHYLGEILAWLGYALAFRHVAAWVIWITMTAYLMGRSHNTVKWYRTRGVEVPDGWKRLVPFLY